MKKSVVFLFAGIFTLAAVQTSKAEVLFSTNFDGYADGNLVGQDNWVSFSGTTNKPVQVSGGTITLQQSAGSGQDDSRDVGATLGAGNTWYYSMDVSVSSSSALVYFTGLLEGTSFYEAKLFVSPSSTGDFTFGIGESTSTAPTLWNTGLSFGTDYKIVVGLNFDAETATLWVDPTSESSTSVSDTGTFQDGAIAIAFRQATPTTDNSQTIDNLIVATSFDDIVAPVPEPSSIALAAFGGVACLLAFRRRN